MIPVYSVAGWSAHWSMISWLFTQSRTPSSNVVRKV